MGNVFRFLAGVVVLYLIYLGATTAWRRGWDTPRAEAGTFIVDDTCLFRTVVSCDPIPGTELYTVQLKDRFRDDYTSALSNRPKAIGELVGSNELYNQKNSQHVLLIMHNVKPPL